MRVHRQRPVVRIRVVAEIHPLAGVLAAIAIQNQRFDLRILDVEVANLHDLRIPIAKGLELPKEFLGELPLVVADWRSLHG